VPGGVGGDDFFEFALVEALDLLDLVHGGLRWRDAKGKKLVMTLRGCQTLMACERRFSESQR
jgi:hypothetical protein